jgi:hypothetical protein
MHHRVPESCQARAPAPLHDRRETANEVRTRIRRQRTKVQARQKTEVRERRPDRLRHSHGGAKALAKIRLSAEARVIE